MCIRDSRYGEAESVAKQRLALAEDVYKRQGQFRPYPILAAFTAPCVSGTEKRYQVQLGRGVMPNLMRPWSPEMAKKLRERRVDARAANQDAVLCLTHFLLNCHFLANIISVSYTHLDVYKRQGGGGGSAGVTGRQALQRQP